MLTLVLGGTRSGKSRIAEQVAGLDRPVTVLATAEVTDADFAERVRAHQDRRPDSWTTIETAARADGLAGALGAVSGPALVDSLGTWLSAHQDFQAPVATLVDALRRRPDDTVVVSEEVGLAVHAESAVARRFVDALGALNHAVAADADRVLLVVAGRVLDLPAHGLEP